MNKVSPVCLEAWEQVNNLTGAFFKRSVKIPWASTQCLCSSGIQKCIPGTCRYCYEPSADSLDKIFKNEESNKKLDTPKMFFSSYESD